MEVSSVLEQYRIADFLEWHESKQLLLNPHFQRRSVWTQPARVLLIDTVLRRLPVPKIYIRTQIDPTTQRVFREVVDGQQRLRAITDFARGDFRLTRRAKEFSGMTYTDLTDELKEAFLTYPIAVDQLINASDTAVLEVFARLNTYTVTLSPAEKRHAKYQGNFKWAVHDASTAWRILWEELRIVSVRERLRMADDALTAEMFGVLLQGVTDGGADRVDKLYRSYDGDFSEEESIRGRLDAVLGFIVEEFGELIRGTPLGRGPQFLLLFAAAAHSLLGIPPGQLGEELPPREGTLSDLGATRTELRNLASVLESPEPPDQYRRFWDASRGSTQRISTRKVRFLTYWEALRKGQS